ncbi:MAG: hypothetical protein P8X42_01365 [Calditrichaceae bacterium]|jgi:hypothetical protein
MNYTKIDIGKTLAHLRLADESAEDTEYIRHFKDKDELSQFRNRLKDLTKSPDRKLIIDKLDEKECSIESPYLKDNTDLFLILLFQTEIPELCSNLGRHLNDCYQCFEIFTQVMQDYYREYQSLCSPA